MYASLQDSASQSLLISLCIHPHKNSRFYNKSSKQWAQVEKALSTCDTQAFPCISHIHRNEPSFLHILTLHLLTFWDKLIPKLQFPSVIGPLIPLFVNPALLAAQTQSGIHKTTTSYQKTHEGNSLHPLKPFYETLTH